MQFDVDRETQAEWERRYGKPSGSKTSKAHTLSIDLPGAFLFAVMLAWLASPPFLLGVIMWLALGD